MGNEPEHVKYWKKIFEVVEACRKPKDDEIDNYIFLFSLLMEGMPKKESHVIILNKDWDIGYYFPSEITKKEEVDKGLSLWNVKSSSDKILRFSEKPPNIFKVILPDIGFYIDEHLSGEPIFGKRWCNKGEPLGYSTIIGESENLIAQLEQIYGPYITESIKQGPIDILPIEEVLFKWKD